MCLYTDASSTKGFGGYYHGKWIYEVWPSDLPGLIDSSLPMAYLELYPTVIAAVLWGNTLSGKIILFYCDNQATVPL